VDLLADVQPQPLARIEADASPLIPWPDTPEGREFDANCFSLDLCLFQIGQLRSGIAVVKCPEEIFVVWLSARVTDVPREDGFLDDTDAALAREALWGELDAILDLTWLESE
jgi:hypothetical protein